MASVRLLVASAGLTAAGMLSAPANATAIVGGTTSVTLTAAPTFTAAGLAVTPTGSAIPTVSGGILTVAFPITGGTRNDSTGALLLNHDGSGLLFSSGSNNLALGNFIVDTAASLVSGNATANGSALGVVPLFNIVAGSSLTLTSQASGAIGTVFSVSLPAGTTIGTARINAVAAVPEPATWMMMIFGFGVLGLSMRRGRRRQLAAA